jgi:hypothetical protein
MHAVPRRLKAVEQLAFRVEGILAGRRASVLEQIARADQLHEFVFDVAIGPADIVDIEPAVGTFVPEHEGSRRDPRNCICDVVVSEPEGPEESCACHRSRRSSNRRE